MVTVSSNHLQINSSQIKYVHSWYRRIKLNSNNYIASREVKTKSGRLRSLQSINHTRSTNPTVTNFLK